jgi:hypothetical protein
VTGATSVGLDCRDEGVLGRTFLYTARCSERQDLLGDVRAGETGEDDDSGVEWSAPESQQRFEAAEVRHREVEEDRVRLEPCRLGNGLHALALSHRLGVPTLELNVLVLGLSAA